MSNLLTLSQVGTVDATDAATMNPAPVADAIGTRNGDAAYAAAVLCAVGQSSKAAPREERKAKKLDKQHKRAEKKDGVKRT